jgi:ABC-type uncharacterized transport system involved in gliding motility auxiliary subunit
MGRTVRAVVAVVLLGVIMFCAIVICQDAGGSLRWDITEKKLYTLSGGTKAILAKINQPLKLKLYYTKTAAREASDQIRYYNNYYYFVRALLEEYVKAAIGMVVLEVIDPRPYSEEEEEALRYGLKRFPITREENFFFGLVLQTGYGVVKSIPFFTPNRDTFVEYDISSIIDAATTRQKKRLGVLSSLPVMGEDVSGFMAQMMRMQGQQPPESWQVIRQLEAKYDITGIDKEADKIEDVDIMLIVHPKDLPEKTLFAVDQFILKGGRAVVCLDPYCFEDKPEPFANQAERFARSRGSNLEGLLKTWGLSMPENTFAGDRALAVWAQARQNSRPQPVIGYLNLDKGNFSDQSAITADLNQVRMLFGGVLRKAEAQGAGGEPLRHVPLLKTTNRGSSWTIDGAYELAGLDPQRLMEKFIDGTEPVVMGYLVTGRFKSAFPEGIEIEVESAADANEPSKDDTGEEEAEKTVERRKGLVEAVEDCAVVVFSDVDFISNLIAYQNVFFGIKVAVDNNSDLLLNAVDELGGSPELIGIRSRGNYQRPFTVVEKIRAEAEAETAEEEAAINAEIKGFRSELQEMMASARKGEDEKLIEASILNKKKDLELKIRQAEKELRRVQVKRREEEDALRNNLRTANMLVAPAVILVVAILLGVRRSLMRKYYVSHASDA